MAVTYAIKKRAVAGNRREVLIDITGPASYTTGGETLTLAQLKAWAPEISNQLATVDFTVVEFFQSERDAAGRQLVLDKTNNKMLAFGAGAEIGNGTNLSAITIRARLLYGFTNAS